MSKKILVSILLFGLIVTVVGCSQAGTTSDTSAGNSSVVTDTGEPKGSDIPKTETPQQPKKGPQIIKIGDLLSNPDSYNGQVVLEGKIISVCGGNGCWFTLNDGTGTIYVDLKPSNLSISPQKRGSSAKVYGEVTKKGSDTYLIGTKVEF
ncbi:MAG: hypothetical protein FJ005_02420 [Chloroflexi bacterium]|nr:hypothetical protein [Chloroflexota bacterium]